MKSNDIRADFPFFDNNAGCIYLDSAATSQKPRCLAEALTEFYNNRNSNISRGEYGLAYEATRSFEGAREKIASWFGTKSDRVAFTQNATDSLNIAAETVGRSLKFGKNVVISPLEHNSAILPIMRLCNENGAEVRIIPLSPDGTPDLAAAEKLIDNNTVAAVFTAGSNVSGYRTPLFDVCDIFDRHGVPLIIDATQAAAHEKIDVSKLKFEYMCLSAHKMYGPTGVGILFFGSERAKNVRARVGGGTVFEANTLGYSEKSGAYAVEAGTPDAAGVIAFGAVIDYLESIDISRFWERERKLAAALREKLADMGARLVPCGVDPFPVVSFDPVFIHPLDAAHLLGANKICVRSGKHCAHIAHEALGFDSTLRVSLGIYNNEDDISSLIFSLNEMKGRY